MPGFCNPAFFIHVLVLFHQSQQHEHFQKTSSRLLVLIEVSIDEKFTRDTEKQVLEF